MNDMNRAIVPKSDQLNADDLLAGPITIKVTGVSIKHTPEQPVAVNYEGDSGKPYKPCKSMCRVMVNAWGADSSKYAGRSMTLFCDPKVRWGGMEVGGIRISHMSHLDGAMTMALTMSKGSRKPFVVKPLATPAAKPATASAASQPAATTQAGEASDKTIEARKKAQDAYDMASAAIRERFDARLERTNSSPISLMSEESALRAQDFLKAAIDAETANQEKQ